MTDNQLIKPGWYLAALSHKDVDQNTRNTVLLTFRIEGQPAVKHQIYLEERVDAELIAGLLEYYAKQCHDQFYVFVDNNGKDNYLCGVMSVEEYKEELQSLELHRRVREEVNR